jgi:hypothetical protein
MRQPGEINVKSVAKFAFWTVVIYAWVVGLMLAVQR